MDNRWAVVVPIRVNGQMYLVRGPWPEEIIFLSRSAKHIKDEFGKWLTNIEIEKTATFNFGRFEVKLVLIGVECIDYTMYYMSGKLIEVCFQEIMTGEF